MQNKKKIIIILITTLLIIGAIVGIVFLVINLRNKDNPTPPTNPPTPPTQTTALKPYNLVQTIGNTTGFIGNNYGAIHNDKIIKENDFKFEVNRVNDQLKYSINKIVYNLISDHNFIGLDIKTSTNLRVGHWNALNFGLLPNKSIPAMKSWVQLSDLPNYTDKSAIHAYFVAKMIDEMNFDVIGLTEINASVVEKDASNFEALMNRISDDAEYKIHLSPEIKGKTITGNGQIEKVAILYNTKKVTSTPKFVQYENPLFEYNQQTQTFTKLNSNPSEIDIKTHYDFVRPPYIINFEMTPNENLSLAFSHNDSPGVSDKAGEIASPFWKSTGNKEYFEAQQIENVLNWTEQKFNSKAIYLGDTNILKSRETKSFSTINQTKYSFAFEDSDIFNSSLATDDTLEKVEVEIQKINDSLVSDHLSKETRQLIKKQYLRMYSQPYDKIIYNKQIPVQHFSVVSPNEIVTFKNNEFTKEFLDLYIQVYLKPSTVMFIYKRKN